MYVVYVILCKFVSITQLHYFHIAIYLTILSDSAQLTADLKLLRPTCLMVK